MLQVADKKRSKTSYDRKVKSMVQGVCRLWDEIEDFERVFKLNLNKFPRLNTIIASTCYQLVKPNSTTIEVWHLNSQSEPDRLLQEIIYKPETF